MVVITSFLKHQMFASPSLAAESRAECHVCHYLLFGRVLPMPGGTAVPGTHEEKKLFKMT
jgi:hypothetical protein